MNKGTIFDRSQSSHCANQPAGDVCRNEINNKMSEAPGTSSYTDVTPAGQRDTHTSRTISRPRLITNVYSPVTFLLCISPSCLMHSLHVLNTFFSTRHVLSVTECCKYSQKNIRIKQVPGNAKLTL